MRRFEKTAKPPPPPLVPLTLLKWLPLLSKGVAMQNALSFTLPTPPPTLAEVTSVRGPRRCPTLPPPPPPPVPFVLSLMSLVLAQGGKNAKEQPPYGADVLRLWVASVDYNSDVLIGGRIVSQVLHPSFAPPPSPPGLAPFSHLPRFGLLVTAPLQCGIGCDSQLMPCTAWGHPRLQLLQGLANHFQQQLAIHNYIPSTKSGALRKSTSLIAAACCSCRYRMCIVKSD